LHRASIVSKKLFIVPTDAHYYKIIEMLKQFKVTILALTCFGSRRNHHQGEVMCLAKTTKWFFCARRYIRSQCYGGISACCAGVQFTARLHNSDDLIINECICQLLLDTVVLLHGYEQVRI